MGNIVLDKEILNKPREKFWISYIKQRIKQNKNFVCFISGPTGSGKSWTSLSIAEQLDPNFHLGRVCFSALELMQLVNSGELKSGSVIVFEEVGVEMSSKNWQSVTNKMINYLLQTFRHRNFILIMNSPYMDFVDASTRKLFHAEISTTGINFKTNECILKPQLIQYNGRNQKFYWKRLKVITTDGILPINKWKVSAPSKDIANQYEEKKLAYTKGLNQKIMRELLAFEKKKAEEHRNKNELTDVQKETLDLLKQKNNVEQVALALNKTSDAVYNSIRLMKKKGFEFKGVKCEDNSTIKYYEVVEPEEI